MPQPILFIARGFDERSKIMLITIALAPMLNEAFIVRRPSSLVFQDLLEHVKQLAYKSSSMHADEVEADWSGEEGALA